MLPRWGDDDRVCPDGEHAADSALLGRARRTTETNERPGEARRDCTPISGVFLVWTLFSIFELPSDLSKSILRSQARLLEFFQGSLVNRLCTDRIKSK